MRMDPSPQDIVKLLVPIEEASDDRIRNTVMRLLHSFIQPTDDDDRLERAEALLILMQEQLIRLQGNTQQ